MGRFSPSVSLPAPAPRSSFGESFGQGLEQLLGTLAEQKRQAREQENAYAMAGFDPAVPKPTRSPGEIIGNVANAVRHPMQTIGGLLRPQIRSSGDFIDQTPGARGGGPIMPPGSMLGSILPTGPFAAQSGLGAAILPPQRGNLTQSQSGRPGGTQAPETASPNDGINYNQPPEGQYLTPRRVTLADGRTMTLDRQRQFNEQRMQKLIEQRDQIGLASQTEQARIDARRKAEREDTDRLRGLLEQAAAASGGKVSPEVAALAAELSQRGDNSSLVQALFAPKPAARGGSTLSAADREKLLNIRHQQRLIEMEKQAALRDNNPARMREVEARERSLQLQADRILATEKTPEGLDRQMAMSDPKEAARISAADQRKGAARTRIEQTATRKPLSQSDKQKAQSDPGFAQWLRSRGYLPSEMR